jgi:hypothetical protein
MIGEATPVQLTLMGRGLLRTEVIVLNAAFNGALIWSGKEPEGSSLEPLPTSPGGAPIALG